MRTITRPDDTDDDTGDVDYLRNLLTPLDPAMPGRAPAALWPEHHAVTRRRSWMVAGLAAAAAVIAILAAAMPLLLAGRTGQSPASAPTARASYDHVQWRDYRGTQLVDTVDWWWNGVDGRDLHRDANGTVTSDVIMRVASAASDNVIASYSATPLLGTTGPGPATPAAGPMTSPPDPTPGPPDPHAAAASLAPTSGTDLTADDFPGGLPSTADGLAKYLGDKHFTLAQGLASLPFRRHLDAAQMTALVSLARSDAASPQVASPPTGQSGLILTLGDSAHGIGDDTRLVLDSSGSRVLGVTYVVDGQPWWRLITVSELTSTTTN